MLNFLKGVFGTGEDVENGIPPHPYKQSTLFLGSPEDICRQYLSMETKTQSFIELSKTSNSFDHYANAQMRQAAYSTVAIHGFVFYLALNEAGIAQIEPTKINSLIYSDFLIEVYDFSWVMLQHCFRLSEYGHSNFGQESITSFLNSDIASEGFPVLVMNYLVSEENALFADKVLQNQIKIKEMYGQNLDEFPKKETVNSFQEMTEIKMIGNPNELLAFDAKYHQVTFSNIDLVMDTSKKISKTVLFNTFMQRISRHLI